MNKAMNKTMLMFPSILLLASAIAYAQDDQTPYQQAEMVCAEQAGSQIDLSYSEVFDGCMRASGFDNSDTSSQQVEVNGYEEPPQVDVYNYEEPPQVDSSVSDEGYEICDREVSGRTEEDYTQVYENCLRRYGL